MNSSRCTRTLDYYFIVLNIFFYFEVSICCHNKVESLHSKTSYSPNFDADIFQKSTCYENNINEIQKKYKNDYHYSRPHFRNFFCRMHSNKCIPVTSDLQECSSISRCTIKSEKKHSFKSSDESEKFSNLYQKLDFETKKYIKCKERIKNIRNTRKKLDLTEKLNIIQLEINEFYYLYKERKPDVINLQRIVDSIESSLIIIENHL
ncbi:hypothetical protein LUQ84_000929 [Hamiltosporidium tvaerminnensis]|nr:hypothetical protein LUQ84_000929 [Hamiltosporidium tvaerminnensis]